MPSQGRSLGWGKFRHSKNPNWIPPFTCCMFQPQLTGLIWPGPFCPGFQLCFQPFQDQCFILVLRALFACDGNEPRFRRQDPDTGLCFITCWPPAPDERMVCITISWGL